MPDTENRADIPEDKSFNPPIQPPAYPTRNHDKPTGTSNHNPHKEERETAAKLKQDQRAWVGIGEPMTVVHFDKNNGVVVNAILRNSGKIPATQIREFASYAIDKADVIDIQNSWRRSGVGQPSVSIPPQGFNTIRFSAKPPIDNIVGSTVLYLYGSIKYNDGVSHDGGETQYCIFVSRETSEDLPRVFDCSFHSQMK